jgi:hypothetical protein
MSHFTVLVIGKNPEKQLEKYDENLEVPEYEKDLVSESEKASFLAIYQVHDPKRTYAQITAEEAEVNKTKSFDELYDQYGDDWNNNYWKKNANGEWGEYSTYSPNSKWDWFTLGGRWTGFFKPKDIKKSNVGNPGVFGHRAAPGWCDQAKKSNIDFEGMRDDAGAKAVERYNQIKTLFGGTIPKLDHKWSEYHLENGPFSGMSIEEKREHYHAQPAMLEVKKHPEELGWGFELDDYDCTVEEFEQRARKSAIDVQSVVKDGIWYQSSDMGWFGISYNENANWEEEFNKLIDEAHPNTLFSLYDCHI